MGEEKKRPIAKCRIGTVQVAKWINTSKKDEKFSSFSIAASYYDKETETYKDSKSLSLGQLNNLLTCIQKMILNEVSEDN